MEFAAEMVGTRRPLPARMGSVEGVVSSTMVETPRQDLGAAVVGAISSLVALEPLRAGEVVVG